MRVRILSDLHLEFGPFDPGGADADVVVLAGDVHIGLNGIAKASELFPKSQIIYVFGNHEFYGQQIPKLTTEAKALTQGSRIHVLENDRVELDGVVFLGATLWTDFKLGGDPVVAETHAAYRMTDFHRIRYEHFYRRFRPEDARALHLKSMKWLERESRETSGKKVVVVTHHAPSAKSVSPSYVNDLLNAAYASDLESLMIEGNIHLWVHGHIHCATDYKVGNTRVIANPRGYPGEPSANFNPTLVVEV